MAPRRHAHPRHVDTFPLNLQLPLPGPGPLEGAAVRASSTAPLPFILASIWILTVVSTISALVSPRRGPVRRPARARAQLRGENVAASGACMQRGGDRGGLSQESLKEVRIGASVHIYASNRGPILVANSSPALMLKAGNLADILQVQCPPPLPTLPLCPACARAPLAPPPSSPPPAAQDSCLAILHCCNLVCSSGVCVPASRDQCMSVPQRWACSACDAPAASYVACLCTASERSRDPCRVWSPRAASEDDPVNP